MHCEFDFYVLYFVEQSMNDYMLTVIFSETMSEQIFI